MQPPGIRQTLLAELDRDDLSIDDLVARSERALAVLAPAQTRYKVTERPDVRTIRYYTSRSLLPKPVNYRGGRARYSGSHLLRLVFIKKRQAEHHTLRKIASELGTMDDRALLDALLPGATSSAMIPASAPVSSIAPRPDADAAPDSDSDADSDADSDSASVRASTGFRRFLVTSEINLDVPDAVLRDPDRRRELSKALQALARDLRGPGSHEKDPDS